MKRERASHLRVSMFKFLFVKLFSGSLATKICMTVLKLFYLIFKFSFFCFMFPISTASLFANCLYQLLCFLLFGCIIYFSISGLGYIFLSTQNFILRPCMILLPPFDLFYPAFANGVLPLVGDFLLFENHPT